jgi:hypothetical protein
MDTRPLTYINLGVNRDNGKAVTLFKNGPNRTKVSLPVIHLKPVRVNPDRPGWPRVALPPALQHP